jgi:hypothetical protein
MGAAFELQKAVYTALTAAVAPVVVYDDTPDNVALPYVQIGEFEEVPWDTDTTIGRETLFVVHTWSRYDGMKDLKDLMDTVKAALHNQNLTVTGEYFVLCFVEDSRSMVDPDGRTRHGVQRFRVITEGT